MSDASGRMLPALTPLNEFFWTSGADGRLRVQRCRACGRFGHPPAPVCRSCFSSDLEATPVSGRGRVYTFTVNRQAWSERLTDPYVIAIVELAEQPGLRLLTDIVGCAPADVHVGMPVEVVFEHDDDVYLPLFRPSA